MRTVTAAVVAAAVLVAGCGGDDENGQEDEPQVDSTDVSDPGVTLLAEARREGSRVIIDYTLTNPGDTPLGMVDIDVTMDGLEPLDGGAYRVSFLRSTADPSGSTIGVLWPGAPDTTRSCQSASRNGRFGPPTPSAPRRSNARQQRISQ